MAKKVERERVGFGAWHEGDRPCSFCGRVFKVILYIGNDLATLKEESRFLGVNICEECIPQVKDCL